jgi:hypothetical protein
MGAPPPFLNKIASYANVNIYHMSYRRKKLKCSEMMQSTNDNLYKNNVSWIIIKFLISPSLDVLSLVFRNETVYETVCNLLELMWLYHELWIHPSETLILPNLWFLKFWRMFYHHNIFIQLSVVIINSGKRGAVFLGALFYVSIK